MTGIIPAMTLRLGFLLDTFIVPVWVRQLAERVSALQGVEIALLIRAEEGQAPRRNRSLESYLAFEKRFLHNIAGLSQPVDLRGTLPGVPIVSADEVREIGDRQLDIVISFLPGRSLPARLGTWSWDDISPTAGFQEVLERSYLMTCTLSAHLPQGGTKTLRRAVFATDWFSAARNRDHVYIKASSILIWALKKLILQGGEVLLNSAPDEEPRRGSSRAIGIVEIAALAFKQAGRALEKKLRPQETWLIFAGKSADRLLPAQTEIRRLLPPQGAYWADPLVFRRNDRNYLFVEEYIRKDRRGRIVCLTLDDDGAKVLSHQPALERPYHLSYPFIFEYDGGTYMIPETASQRAIELYRCVNWPDQWEFSRMLMKDVYAVDTTLFEHGGRWWLFTNLLTEKGASSWDELHLFSAADPLSSDWTPHPLNPVISDARLARPAGPLFVLDGILYRPSQDSSRRYGYALNLNRIDILTGDDYAETCIEKILPQSGYLATHTYSRAGGWVFMDGVTRKPDGAA